MFLYYKHVSLSKSFTDILLVLDDLAVYKEDIYLIFQDNLICVVPIFK